MTTVEFTFNLDQEVITPFGKEGIIEMLAFDGEGQKYWIQTEQGGSWFKERNLAKKA
jgi:hypothetical protein